MALTCGTKLGPYEVQLLLGAGGMGEVYRARDTRLERMVAIRILPVCLSSNPEQGPFRARSQIHIGIATSQYLSCMILDRRVASISWSCSMSQRPLEQCWSNTRMARARKRNRSNELD